MGFHELASDTLHWSYVVICPDAQLFRVKKLTNLYQQGWTPYPTFSSKNFPSTSNDSNFTLNFINPISSMVFGVLLIGLVFSHSNAFSYV